MEWSSQRAKTQLLNVVPPSLNTHTAEDDPPPTPPPRPPDDPPPDDPPPDNPPPAPPEPPAEPPATPPDDPPAVEFELPPAVPPPVIAPGSTQTLFRHTRDAPQSPLTRQGFPFRSGEGPINREHADPSRAIRTAGERIELIWNTRTRVSRNTEPEGRWCMGPGAEGVRPTARQGRTRRHYWRSSPCNLRPAASTHRFLRYSQGTSRLRRTSTSLTR